LYSEDGNGGGGVNVNVCVSRTVLVFETVVRLVFVRRANGANTVRYDGDCDDSFKANGFVGKGDDEGAERDMLLENGSRVESSDDSGIGSRRGTGRLIYDDSLESRLLYHG
jgi:hypothetical protein